MILAILHGRMVLFLDPALLKKVRQHIFKYFPFAVQGSGYFVERSRIL